MGSGHCRTGLHREPIENKVMRHMVDREKKKKKRVGMKGFTAWLLYKFKSSEPPQQRN